MFRRPEKEGRDPGADVIASPYRILSAAALLGLACVALSTRVALQQPWLGVDLRPDEGQPGVVVEDVHAGGPAGQILTPGDSVVSIRSPSGLLFLFQASDLVEDPDVFPTFQGYNSFEKRQGLLAGILSEPVVELGLADGRKIKVQPAPSRPFSSLPLDFWMLNAMGVTIFMIGAAVWSVRRRDMAVLLFFFSGAGLLITTTSMAIIISREVAFDPILLTTVREIYHAGNNIFSVFGLGLLYHYPSVLGSFPFTRALAVLAAFFWLNEHFQWMDIPGHTVLVQPVLYFVLGAIVGVLQWRRSKGHPVERAALKWFMLSFLGFIGFGFFIYFVPAVLVGYTVVPIAFGLGSVTLTYLGLALGILRYRLFDIDRWWFGFWLWFLAGVSVLALDGILAFTIVSDPSIALVISLILVGWFYFPARQWIWSRLYRRRENRLERHLPAFLAGIVGDRTVKTEAWIRVLQDVFVPLSDGYLDGPITEPRLENHGETMLVPTLDGVGGIELRLAERGSRLFSPRDAALAKTLYQIARSTEDRLTVYRRGAGEERERIMRDLHDEVGGRLLSIAQSSSISRNTLLARNALKALRDIIYSINPVKDVTLEEALAAWRYEYVQRCEDAGVALHWENGAMNGQRLLKPRQMVNLSRTLLEASTNALVHATPKNIWVYWEMNGHDLIGTVRNDGTIPQNAPVSYGKGIRNMQKRMNELGGLCTCEILPAERVFVVNLSIPVAGDR
ncbi:MAG: hypothetical protein RQ767_00830 [Thermovirgaceae bacterium]|nr:hypothetical protein [Thermovirgaceae bacterium]